MGQTLPTDPSNPPTTPGIPPETVTVGARLESLDVLRGFVMFWIIGASLVLRAALKDTQNPYLRTVWEQLEHVPWDGFHFLDLIFPLFLFMIGVAIPFSLGKRLARGDSRVRIYGHIVLRVLILIFLGMMVHGNLLSYDPHRFQITYSVLQMLALGYLVAAVLYLNGSPRWQVGITAGLLGLYWALLTYVPLPGSHVVGVYEPGANFGDWLNDQILGNFQKRWRLGWILAVMTHAATCMLGVFAGTILRSISGSGSKIFRLILLGLFCLAAGWGWSYSFPMIKNRWTSSYALFAGGWSYLLLALFYLIIDMCGFRRWALPWKVIGLNAIVAYVGWSLFYPAFRRAAEVLTAGLKPYAGPWQETITLAVASLLFWLVLYWMYRKQSIVRI